MSQTILPLFLKAKGRSVLLLGGGREATRWAYRLVESGVKLTVVTQAVSAEIVDLAKGKGLRLKKRAFRDQDLKGVCLVLALEESAEQNRKVARKARSKGLLVYLNHDRGDFALPAWFNRGELWVSVWTGGIAPWLQQVLFRRLYRAFPAEWADLLDWIKRYRIFSKPGSWPSRNWWRRWGRVSHTWLVHLKKGRLKALRTSLTQAKLDKL